MTRSPASRRWWKRRLPIAGQDQHDQEEDGHEPGEVGRSESQVRVPPGTDAEEDKENQGRKGEDVSGEAGEVPKEGSQFGDIRQDVGLSLLMTVLLAVPLAVCALGAGTAGWRHIAVAIGYWCALFGISFWVVLRKCAGNVAQTRIAFVECRLAIGLIGIAAVTFRSPVLLEVVPDILAVAIAASGCMDGIAVGDSRRVQAAARCRASRQETAEGRL